MLRIMNIELKGFWEKFSMFLGVNGLSLNRAASQMNIPYTTLVSNMKKNQLPSAKYLKAIAKYIGVSEQALLDDSWIAIRKKAFSAEDSSKTTLSNLTCYFLKDKLKPNSIEEFTSDEDFCLSSFKLQDLFGLPSNCFIGALIMKDNSMSGLNIGKGDIVLFNRDIIDSDGLNVVAIDDIPTMRRIQYNNDPENPEITFLSENPLYPSISDKNADGLRILGKVVGWFHNEI